MPTNNPRLNITLDNHIMMVVTDLAEYEHKSISSLAKELIIEALERREDQGLSTIADIRDKKNAKMVTHEHAWK